jgi:putative intracellular protease/amidase
MPAMKTLSNLLLPLLLAFALPLAAQPPHDPEHAMHASRRILFVLTSHDRKGDQPSGFYLSEVTHPHKVLHEAGYAIDFASPKGGKAPVDGFDLDDPVNAAFWNDPVLREAVGHTLSPAQVDPADYAAIFYAGGHATMWDLPGNAALAAITARIYEAGGVVAAVCHGPAGLVDVVLADGRYLVAGNDVAAFTNAEERAVGLADVVPFLLADRLEQRGARHHPAPDFTPQVVVSERLVTGQNPQSATGVAEAMLGLLGDADQGNARP